MTPGIHIFFLFFCPLPESLNLVVLQGDLKWSCGNFAWLELRKWDFRNRIVNFLLFAKFFHKGQPNHECANLVHMIKKKKSEILCHQAINLAEVSVCPVAFGSRSGWGLMVWDWSQFIFPRPTCPPLMHHPRALTFLLFENSSNPLKSWKNSATKTYTSFP